MSTTTPCSLVYVPGPQGPAGANGTNGTNGSSAYTLLSAIFTMPAELGSAVATVLDTAWMVPGQVLYLQAAGWLQVASIGSSTSVTLKNLKSTASSLYLDNAAPGTAIPASSRLAPAGEQGPAGVNGTSGAPTDATYLTRTAEAGLSAEFNLGALTTGLLKHTVAAGVSTPATASDGTDYLSPTTGLRPADISTSVQAYHAFLESIGVLGTAANKMLYTTGVATAAEADITAFGRSLVAAATAAAAQTLLNVLPGYGLLGSISAIDLNSAATDTAFTINAARYIIDKVTVDNASINLTTATLGVFTAAGGGGTTLAADQVLSAMTATTKFHDLTLAAIVGTDARTDTTLYARVGSAQGSAATANVFLFGWRLA